MQFHILPILFFLASISLAETIVLRGFTLIDGTGKPAVPQAAMVVTDGRIRAAGPAAKITAPAGASEVNLAGKYVIPGIINLHGHLGNVIDLTQDPKNFTRENVEKQLRTYAQYGVTAVLSMGSDQPLIYEMRRRQRAGRPAMARIFTAGRGFTGPSGYPTTMPGMKGVPYEVASPVDVDKAIAELARHQPDVVKVWVDDHLGKEKKIPTDITKALIASAKKRGLGVCAHIFYYEDAKALSDAGLYACAHSVRDRLVDDALAASMRKNGTWQFGTLAREYSTFAYATPPDFLRDPFFTRSVSKGVIATIDSDAYRNRVKADKDLPRYPEFLATAQKNLKRLYDAGVKVGFGTDTGPPARFSGFFEHKEMDLMVEAGFKPNEIITIFSKNSAEFLGASKDLGTLEAGHWADLIVLSRNPLDNIRNTRSIESVYIAGNKVN
jgi:imidazolonepropionase-like amidohydrolase